MRVIFAEAYDDIPQAKIVSCINIVFLVAAGLFTIIWPIIRITSSSFPDTCGKTGFILSTLLGFCHIAYAFFLFVWVVFIADKAINRRKNTNALFYIRLWFIGLFTHAACCIVFGTVGIVSLFVIMDDYCIDSSPAKWGLFIAYILFMASALGSTGTAHCTNDDDEHNNCSSCMFWFIFPLAQISSPFWTLISIFSVMGWIQ